MIGEKDIIKGCIKGDRHAQRAFYNHFAPKMMAVSARYAKSTGEAEDIIQEAFIKIFKSIDKFRGESRLDYWVKRIVINTALNYQRSKLYMFPMVDVEDISFKTNDDYSIEGYQFEELLALIRTLPEGCQIIFNLFAIEGFSHKEIASMLEISEGTSKSQYARARSLLQKKLLKEKNVNYGTV